MSSNFIGVLNTTMANERRGQKAVLFIQSNLAIVNMTALSQPCYNKASLIF